MLKITPGGGGVTNYFTNEFSETIDLIRNFAQKNLTPLAHKNFYLFHGRNQVGEERIANYFQSKGYAVIRPETLSIEEQLNIYANCENYASSLGSIAHNTLFTKDNINAIFIPRLFASNRLNSYQNAINDLRNLNVSYIDTTLSVYATGGNGSYCYIISEQLKKYFGDEWNGEYSEEDFVTFLNYIIYSHQYSKIQNQNFNVDIAKYYDPILPDFMTQLKKREDLLQKFGITIN